MDEGDAVRRMVVIGDSICFGQFVYPHKTWVHLLSQVAPMPIDNFSWCGDTTRTALERSLPLVQRDGCDVAYVQFGCNDANKWDTDLGLPRVSVGAFAANLHEIVARCRAAGASEVVIGTNHKTNIDTSAYDAVAAEVARGLGLPCVENCATTLDGVHLDEAGHHAYFSAISTALGW